MSIQPGGMHLVVCAALLGLSCSAADSDDGLDGGSSLAQGTCPEGQFVAGINEDGTLVCQPPPRPAQQMCSGRQVVGGIRSDGTILCVEPFAETTCPAGQFMTGIDATGQPSCVPAGAAVRDYINTNCFVYIGWRDSCDGCIDVPVKTGRARGELGMCGTAGADGDCAMFDLFGQTVEMTGISTDGDVNDDDKFWIGLKCE